MIILTVNLMIKVMVINKNKIKEWITKIITVLPTCLVIKTTIIAILTILIVIVMIITEIIITNNSNL